MSEKSKTGWEKLKATALATGPEAAAAVVESLRPKLAAAKAESAEAEKAAPPLTKRVIGKLRMLPRTVIVPGKKKVIGVRGGRVP